MALIDSNANCVEKVAFPQAMTFILLDRSLNGGQGTVVRIDIAVTVQWSSNRILKIRCPTTSLSARIFAQCLQILAKSQSSQIALFLYVFSDLNLNVFETVMTRLVLTTVS